MAARHPLLAVVAHALAFLAICAVGWLHPAAVELFAADLPSEAMLVVAAPPGTARVAAPAAQKAPELATAAHPSDARGPPVG